MKMGRPQWDKMQTRFAIHSPEHSCGPGSQEAPSQSRMSGFLSLAHCGPVCRQAASGQVQAHNVHIPAPVLRPTKDKEGPLGPQRAGGEGYIEADPQRKCDLDIRSCGLCLGSQKCH